MGGFSRDSLDSFLRKVQAASDAELVDILGYKPPEYVSSKTGEPLSSETMRSLDKLFTNLDKPVAGIKVGGLLPGMILCKQSRAPADSRVITGRMIQGNQRFGDAVSRMEVPDFINDVGGPFYKAVWDEYGDDSVARNADFAAVFENVSMLEAMTAFHHRVLFGIEKSTRYVDYSKRDTEGNFNYIVDPLIREAGLEDRFREVTDREFELYARVMDKKSDDHQRLMNWLQTEFLPFETYRSKVQETFGDATDEELQKGYDKTIAAAFKDQVRHLLPLSARTTLGIAFNASAMREFVYQGQSRYFGEGIILSELFRREMGKIVGPLLDHTDADDSRATSYRHFLFETRRPDPMFYVDEEDKSPDDYQGKIFDSKLNLSIDLHSSGLVRIVDPKLDLDVTLEIKGTIDDIVEAILKDRVSSMTTFSTKNIVGSMSEEDKLVEIYDYAGMGCIIVNGEINLDGNNLRTNRRHRPGRAFERIDLETTMLMPIAEIRDIRRHTVQSYLDLLNFAPEHGYYVSPGLRAIGMNNEISEVNADAEKLWNRIYHECGPHAASTILPMSYRAPMNTRFNFREAHHILELRTQPGAAPVYLRLCQMIYAGLKVALPELSKTIKFVNEETETDYGRAIQESRSIARRKKNPVKVELA